MAKYMDYDSLYQLTIARNTYKLEKSEDNEKDLNLDTLGLEETALKTIHSSSKKYTVIHLTDLIKEKKYDNKCFCYLVITEKILTQFYNWWC